MTDGHGGPEEPVGSAAEEAAKLFGALGDWAKERSARDLGADAGSAVAGSLAGSLAAGLASLGAHAARAASELNRDLDAHLATGAPECTYCPICRTVHVVREAGPEVRAHLASAAASLMQAAASVLDAAASSGSSRRRSGQVETIDLADGADGWPDDGPGDWPEDGPEEET